MFRLITLNCLVSLFCFASLPATLIAGDRDWPQWRGPDRDGHAAEQSLLQKWPAGGPKLATQFDDVGRGYSAMSVVDGRLFTLGADEQQTFAICLDVASGDEVWRTPFSATGVDGDYNLGWGGGPRSTPTVDGDDIYVLSDVGVLACLGRSDGRQRWSVDLVEAYGGKIPTWGYSESVLIDNGVVLCVPGEKNFMLGFDRATGEKVWQSDGIDAPAQYASIMKATANGEKLYVTASKTGLFGIKVSDGTTLFREEGSANKVATIPTPIVTTNRIYHTSDYGSGCVLLNLQTPTPTLMYHMTDKTMRNHHGGVVLVDGVIYGFTKANGGAWMAQDMESGKVLWENRIRPNKSGSIAYADGRLYCYNDKDGVCHLVIPNRNGWQSVGSVALPRQTELARDKGAIWAHPVIADGKLFIRDQDLIFAFDIAR